MSIILTVIILGLIVLVHEFGHFIVSIFLGIKVDEFSIGFGKEIFSFQKKDIQYSLRWILLGGYCRYSEEQGSDKSKVTLNNAKLYKRFLTVSAGSFMNFILAFVILSGIISYTGYTTPEVSAVMENYPAQAIGIKAGDEFVRINGYKISSYNDFTYALSQNPNKEISVEIRRDNQIIAKKIKPKLADDGRYILGVNLNRKAPLFYKGSEYEKVSFIDCLNYGYKDMVFYIKATFYGFKSLISGEVNVNDMSGPIGLTSVVDETYKESIKYSFLTMILTLLNLTALLSANIGVLNLFPLPGLDGGRIIFLLYELVFRKPFPQEKEGVIHFLGMIVLMLFAVYIAFNDILKLI